MSGKQLSREPFLPDTASFIGDLLVNNTEQHCLLYLSDDLMIFTPTFLCQPHKPPLVPRKLAAKVTEGCGRK